MNKSTELSVCDHCEYVTQCNLVGPEDRSCPKHYDLYTDDIEIMTVKIAKETNRVVKVKTEEREIIILLTEEDFRILEYVAYQLEISLERYIEVSLKLEAERIQRKYGL
ncbi:MAG: hypothetical protein ACFE9L_12510 [Candidatus Hodarchaeota archaeon]